MPSQAWHIVGAQPRWVFFRGRGGYVAAAANVKRVGRGLRSLPRPLQKRVRVDSLAGMTPLCEDHHTCSSTPPQPFQGPVIGFPSVTAPPLPSHGTVFSSTAPVCLPPPASDGTPIHYLFLILCFSTSFPSNANWTRKVNEQLPGTYSIAGSQTEVISVLIGGPISQMRATEAQR